MDPFTLFVVSALIFVAGELLRPLPKSRDRSAVPFEEARLPSTNPQQTVQKAWGRARIQAPHLMGVTEYSTVDIEREVKTLFKSKDVTIGFRYFAGMYMGVGSGVQNIRKIYHGGVLLWDIDADGFTSQSATDGDVIDINLPDFLGGREAGGGLIGRIRWYRGDANQRVDPYIAGFVDHQPTPAYRFTAYAIFENFEMGESPNLAEFEFVTDSQPPDHLGLGVNLRIDGAETDSEVNPMAIAADLLIDDNFGQGEDISALDVVRLKAMGDTLATELNGMTLKWVNEETTEKLFRIIQDQIQGTIFKKIGDGRWAGRLVRDDFDPNTIRVVNMSNVRELTNFSRRNWPETSNQAIIDWKDRDLDRDPTPAVEHDFSNFRRIRRAKSDRKTYPAVYSSPLAVQIASRAIKQIAFPFASGNFTGDRTFYDAEPGEPMKLEWPPLGLTLIIRCTAVGYGTSELGDMPLSFVEDFFSLGLSEFGGLEAGVGSPVNTPPVAVATFLGFEMPYFLQVQDPLVEPPTSGTQAINKLAWIAQPPQTNALQYRMWEESIAGTAIIASELASYTSVGDLQADLPESTTDSVVVVIENVTLPSRMLEDGAATEAQIKSLGFGLAFIEDGTGAEEFVGVTAIADNGDGTYNVTMNRGLVDTLPKDWLASSARVWFLGTGMSSTPFQHGDADVISYQAENQATTGFGPLSAIQNRTFTARSDKPYPAGNFEITDTSPQTVKYPVVPLATGDITFDWEGRDRTTGGILFQDDNGVVENGFEYFLTLYDNTNPGLPVVLRRVGRGASGAPGNNDPTPLTGEQFIWAEALQLLDDPTGNITDILVELRTLGDTVLFSSTIFNREDVSRVFERTIPLPPPTGLGGVYRAYVEAEAGLTAYWPFDEQNNGQAIEETVGGLVTSRVGNPGSGGRPLVVDDGQHSIYAPGDGLGVSELTVPDDPVFDLGDTWSLGFWIQCRPFLSTGSGPIFEIGRTLGSLSRIRSWLDNGLGIVRFGAVDAGGTGAIVDFPDAADGQPHFIMVTNDTTGGAREMRGYMDGVLVDTPAPAIDTPAVSERAVYFMGGIDPAWVANYRGMLGHFQIYNVEKTEAEVRANYLTGARRLGYQQLVKKAPPDHWYRLTDYDEGAKAVDWGTATPLDATQVGTPTTRVAGPLSSPQQSYGMTFDGVSDRIALSGTLLDGDTYGCIEFWFKTSDAGVGALFDAINSGNARLFRIRHVAGIIRVDCREFAGGPEWRLETIATTFNDGVWHHFVLYKESASATPRFLIDGRGYSVSGGQLTQTLVSTFNGLEWITDVDDLGLEYSLGAQYNGTTISNQLTGEMSDVQFYRNQAPSLENVIGRYLAGASGYRSPSDIMLDEDLHHGFEIEDFLNIADIANNMGGVAGVWNNTGGNLQLTNQMPLAADDDLESVWIPRDGNTANAVFAKFTGRAFLEGSKGTLNFHDYGFFYAAAPILPAGRAAIFANVNAGAARTNLFVEFENDGGLRTDKFLPGDTWLLEQGLQQTVRHDSYREERTSANASPDFDNGDRRILSNLAEVAYNTTVANSEPTKVEIYAAAGGAMDDAYIGVWDGDLSDNSRNFGGLLSRLAFWDRPPSRFRMLLNNLRGNGYHEYPLYVLAYEPELFWRFDELDPAATAVLDSSPNKLDGTIRRVGTGTATFDEAANRNPVWHQDKGMMRVVGPLNDTNYAGAELENPPIDSQVYPYTIQFTGFADGSSSNFEYVNVSLVSTLTPNDRLRFAIIGAGADQIQVLVVNNGVVSNVTVATPNPTDDIPRTYTAVFHAANDIDVYQDGEFVTNFTTFAGAAFTANFLNIGFEEYLNPGPLQTAFGGTVCDVALYNKALTTAQVRETVLKLKQPKFDQAVAALSPSSYHTLEEHEVGGVFRNRIRDGVGQIIQGATLGAVPGAQGLIPNYPTNTANMTGGGVNTNWLAYPVGGVARTFSVWVDGPYVGTVWSMGANVNTQALIIEITAGGDVDINIRGAGNLRRHTGTFNVGLAKLLTVVFDGVALTGTRVFQDNTELLAVPIPGAAVALATVPALPMHLGVDVTDQATPAGVGRLQRASVYPVAHGQAEVDKLFIAGVF